MRQRAFLGMVIASMLAAACGSGGSSGTGGEGATAAGGTGGATTSSSTTASGTGGATTSSSTTASGTGGSATTSSSSSSSSSGGTTTDHLVISEIGVQPANGEFIEIYNPTAAAVDLSKYYLSDNATYHGIAAGMPWNPTTSNPGTDFLAQFPAGTMLAPGAAIVIATDPTFEAHFNKCPDFILGATPVTCANGTAAAMIAPTNGGLGTNAGTLLSNDREMVILFTWDGTSSTLKDVDYVTWGATFDDATRVDKTGIAGYQADTPRASQKSATAPGMFQSIERCTFDASEKPSGGNGITGQDVTSEALDTAFVVQATPTPGAKNACLP